MDGYELRQAFKRIQERMCKHFGHEWGTWHRMLVPDGKGEVSHEERSCLECGKGDRRPSAEKRAWLKAQGIEVNK